MSKEINALEVRQHFGKILNDVSVEKETYIVTKNGRPVMILLNVKTYEELQSAPRGEISSSSFIKTYSRERIEEFLEENKRGQADLA